MKGYLMRYYFVPMRMGIILKTERVLARMW